MNEKYNKYKLSEQEHKEILFSLIEDMQIATSASSQPTVLIISGQPGCGKSSISDTVKMCVFSQPNTVATINGDEYRKVHPRSAEIFKLHDKEYAKYTDPDVRLWTSELFDWAAEHKRDIIFESTLRQKEPINSTIKQLKAKGYKVCIAVMAVPAEISRTNIVLRYENAKLNKGAVARWTDFEAHDNAYREIPDTIDFLERYNGCIESIKLFVPEADYQKLQLVYDNISHKETIGVKAVLEQCRNRKLTAEEKTALGQKQARIFELMKTRGVSIQDINYVDRYIRGC